jgi:hypothetical protein
MVINRLRLGYRGVAIVDQGAQRAHVAGALCCDHAHLGQMSAQAVEELGALGHQHLARLVLHQHRLVGDRANLDEAQPRAGQRFANRRRVIGIVLLPLDEGLHIDRRDQLHRMTQRHQFAPPVMGRTACLHADKAVRQRCEKRQNLAPA